MYCHSLDIDLVLRRSCYARTQKGHYEWLSFTHKTYPSNDHQSTKYSLGRSQDTMLAPNQATTNHRSQGGSFPTPATPTHQERQHPKSRNITEGPQEDTRLLNVPNAFKPSDRLSPANPTTQSSNKWSASINIAVLPRKFRYQQEHKQRETRNLRNTVQSQPTPLKGTPPSRTPH